MSQQNFGNWWNAPPSAELSQALSGLLRDLFLRAPADLLARLANAEGPAENVYKVREEHNSLIGLCYHPSLVDETPSLLTIPPFIFGQKWVEFENTRRKEYDEKETTRSASDYRLYRRPFRTRYELYTEPAYALEFASRLVYPGDQETSVYFRTEELDGDVGWNWPLRIGFLPDDASGWLFEELKTYVRDIREWVGLLVDLVRLDSETDTCDLLLIPANIRHAAELVSNLGIRISADCVLAIGPMADDHSVLPSTIEVFRDKVSTAGVGIAQFDTPWRDGFTTLIRELSHNEPIDVALFAACNSSGRPPFLAASRKLIEFSKLAESIKSMGEELSKAPPQAKPITIKDADAEVFGIKPGDYHPTEIGGIFRNNTDKFMFDQERGSGIRSARVSRSAKRSMRESAKPEEVEPRRIHAKVHDLSPGEKARAKVKNALRAGAPHQVVIGIGTNGDGWIQNSEEFNPPELSDKKTYKLTVIFMEPQLFDEPQVSSIKLPPEGNSTECEFKFQVPEVVEKIEARISIVYKNRVLQTALLKADVVADPDDTGDEHQIKVVPEAIVRADLSGLKDRRNFDGAFILNHDTANAPGLTAIKDKYASFASLGELETFVRQVDEFMTRVADYPAQYAGKLDTPATVTLLCDLAKHGQILYGALAEYPRGNMHDIFSELSPTGPKVPQRIQIISAKSDTRLPMEFLYDRTAPEDSNGQLCPKAVEALKQDACFPDCPGIQQPEKHVCPMGFWGLSKIIERHTYKNDYTETTLDGSFRFQSEPVEGRKHLDVFRGVLFGASNKADKIEVRSADGNTVTVEAGGLKKVLSTLDTVTNSKYQKVDSWQDWRDKINSAPSPTALLLLTHTEKKGSVPALEIEQGVLVEMQSIKKDYVYSQKEPYPPVVFLIGCETGAADIEFMNFVAQFRRGGAAIIVSTGAPIRGRHAVPVTVELLNQLKQLSGQPAMSFGQVMRIVKQRMVADGFPMVLTLMTYGDADWQIGTSQA